MTQIGDRNNRTILGYHDKSINQYALTGVQLPILIEENYSPFLITDKQHYSISTKDITTLVNNYKALSIFNSAKNKVAQIFLLPGLVVSIAYMLSNLGIDKLLLFFTDTVSKSLLNFLFWVSIACVIVLWHDYFRTKTHPVRIPSSGKIDQKTMTVIQNTGIEFARYKLLKAVHYLDEDSQRLLIPYISTKGIETFELFKELLSFLNIQKIVSWADLDLNLESLEKHQIKEKTMPEYPLASVRSIIVYSLEEAILTNSLNIQPRHIFLAYMKTFPILKKYISKHNSSIELLREIVWHEVEEERKVREADYFDLSAPFYSTGGIARDWVYGYTFLLNKFSKDITKSISNERGRYGIGHRREVEELISVLGKLSKNNALLIGEPGVGKSSLIKGVAQQINIGEVPQQIQGKRIIQLDLNGLIALSSSEKSIEMLVQQSMNELEKAGNVILYIDEIQEIIPAKAEESGHSLAGILLPYILEGKFPIVGAINYSDYKKYFYSSESLRTSFENIEVSELSPADTLRILETKIKELEGNYELAITFPALTAAIELSQRYITNRKLPDSAVNTIESAASWAQSQGLKKLTSSDVAKSVSLQANIPVENITPEEATTLMDLENRIKEKVVGQDEAVNAVVESLKRARTDIRDPNKPIGVFLFMGPTGTGKTYLSKVIAEEFFGSENKMVRLDLSEYQEITSINKILGNISAAGFGQTEVTLLDKVKSTPYTVVLLDEIEKAHPQILDLFLQLFDEGRLTSNTGEAVNFTNTIIISTTNVGSLKLLQALERDRSMWEEAKQNALLELRGVLRPELLNRFDKIVVFSPHNINNLVSITKLLLNKLAERIGKRGISLEWDESIPMLIADKAQEPGMGARPIKRFIQDKIESKVSDEIIHNKLNSGSQVVIRESWLRG